MAEQVTVEIGGLQDGRLTPVRLAPGDTPRRYRIPPIDMSNPSQPERYRMRPGVGIRPFKLQPWTRPCADTLRPFLRVVSRNDTPLSPCGERPALRLVASNDDLPAHNAASGSALEVERAARRRAAMRDSPAG
jgi:hypothetical protein